MIDELELLLEEVQEEPEENAQLLTAVGIGTPILRTGGTAVQADDEQKAAERAAERQFDAVVQRSGAALFKEMTEKPAPVQGEDSALLLYQTLMRTRHAVQVQPVSPVGGRTPLIRETKQPERDGSEILRLDRAFQRDARRYDGGFTWQ